MIFIHSTYISALSSTERPIWLTFANKMFWIHMFCVCFIKTTDNLAFHQASESRTSSNTNTWPRPILINTRLWACIFFRVHQEDHNVVKPNFQIGSYLIPKSWIKNRRKKWFFSETDGITRWKKEFKNKECQVHNLREECRHPMVSVLLRTGGVLAWTESLAPALWRFSLLRCSTTSLFPFSVISFKRWEGEIELCK